MNDAEPTPDNRERVYFESGTNRGWLFGLVLPLGVGEAGVPASVVAGEGVVEGSR